MGHPQFAWPGHIRPGALASLRGTDECVRPYMSTSLRVDHLHAIDRIPRRRRLQLVVDIVNVLHALGFEPLAEGGCAVLGVDGDAVFPRGAAAQDAVELHARFSGKFKSLAEFGVADAR